MNRWVCVDCGSEDFRDDCDNTMTGDELIALKAERDRLREALELIQRVLTDDKDDKVNRSRLVADTALALNQPSSDKRD